MSAAVAGHAAGAVLGLVAACGVLLVLRYCPWSRRPDLQARMAPYLPSAARPGTGGTHQDLLRSTGQRLVAAAADGVGRVLGGTASVRRRLDAAGSAQTVAQFRAEQVLWGLAGAGTGLGLVVLVGIRRGWAPAPMALLVLLAVAGGVLARDTFLSTQVRRRQDRLVAEFPAVAELLALAVGAGESAVAAVERVARTCSGEVASELLRVLGEVRTGVPLVPALEGFARRCDLPVVSRFVDAVAVAVERGTPLADVLRAQAQDAREVGQRQLMEAGGRKEVLMMVPVVLLVLPVTVVFAVFPGLAVLRVGP